MPYKVEITEIKKVPVTEQVWRKLHDQERSGQYGYVAPPEGAERTVEEKVYEQTVDDLHMRAVISAINYPV